MNRDWLDEGARPYERLSMVSGLERITLNGKALRWDRKARAIAIT